MPLSGDMTYLLTHLQTSERRLKHLDIAPIAARYMALILSFNALRIARSYERLPAMARKIHDIVRVLIKARTHNYHVELKLSMLANPAWRTRVLRELGGLRKLELWIQALLRADGQLAKRWIRPAPAELVWVRTDERIAKSEALKAHARLCAKACAPEGIFRDPYRMDRAGQFRLTPLPRSVIGKPHRPVIYSKLTIGDYNFNAVPVYKPHGFGPASVSPLEFIAAKELVFPAKHSDEPGSHASDTLGSEDLVSRRGLVREQVEGLGEDFLPLPEFLGMASYLTLFYKPP